MSLPFFIALLTTVVFGALAIYFSISEEKLRKTLQIQETTQKRRLYEIETLKAIQDRIGYSLDVERVIDTLTGSLKNLFPYSTASSLILEQNKLIFKTTIDEEVSGQFVTQVKKSMTASLSALLNTPLPSYIEEVRTGLIPNDTNQKPLSSFFHIPLVVNCQVVGLINVSSTKPGLYKDEDMTILYQMTSLAASALSRLREFIQTEEDKLLAMIGSLSDGILFIDNSSQLTLINATAKKILGLEHDSITFSDILSIFSQYIDIPNEIHHAITEKQTIKKDNIQLHSKILTMLFIPVIKVLQGKETIIGTTIMLQDMTLENSLAQLKEDFTNGIVHELRSPLTAIKSGAELLLTDTNLTASQEKLLHIIDEQTKRMLADITSLLDAAKIEAGKLIIEKKEEDISQLFHDIVALFAPEAENKQLTLRMDIEPSLPKAYIDKQKITEVLQNLVSNSLKFTSQGGSITLSAHKIYHEHLPPTPINPGVLLAVTDTGIGIPKDRQALLFSKFAQVGSSELPQAKQGTGLGLYISKGIVKAHGGNIFLSSKEGKGTTISFTLPMSKPQSAINTADIR